MAILIYYNVPILHQLVVGAISGRAARGEATCSPNINQILVTLDTCPAGGLLYWVVNVPFFTEAMTKPAASHGVFETARNKASFGEFTPRD